MTATPGLIASWLSHATKSRNLEGDTAKRYFGHVLVSLRVAGNEPLQHPDGRKLLMVVNGIKQKPTRKVQKDDDVQWSLSQLLEYLASQRTASLNTRTLRTKTLCLLMVAGIARPSDLARLDFSTYRSTSKGISLRVWRAKNSGAGFSEPLLLPRLPQKHAERCPVRTLEAYLQAVRDARTRVAPYPDGFEPVFLSLLQPYQKLSAARVSECVKEVLRTLKLDIRTYAVRAKSATEAMDKGYPIAMVAKAGRWRSLNVLQNHYNRTRNTDELVTGLLSSP